MIVLGAGIQGCTLALALAAEGCSVTLVDASDRPMTRASEVNEGKIHLGHVYARDPSGATSELMLEAALQFAPLIEGWVGRPIDWALLRSTPFVYLQMAESLSTTCELVQHYERLDSTFRHRSAPDRSNYIGTAPERLWIESPVPAVFVDGRAVWAAATPEVAVEPVLLRSVLLTALERSPRISLKFEHHIDLLEQRTSGYTVSGRVPDGSSWSCTGDLVANCLWADRLRVDEMLGVEVPDDRLFRRKFRVLFERPAGFHLPNSVTMVLGPFGDIVTRRGSEQIYVSWYPACLRGWTDAVAPPGSWSVDDELLCRDVLAATRVALLNLVPQLARATPISVRSGVIYAPGRSDIDEPNSALHMRSRIGPRWHDGYVSVDTGKFTTAPLFAAEIAANLSDRRLT